MFVAPRNRDIAPLTYRRSGALFYVRDMTEAKLGTCTKCGAEVEEVQLPEVGIVRNPTGAVLFNAIKHTDDHSPANVYCDRPEA